MDQHADAPRDHPPRDRFGVALPADILERVKNAEPDPFNSRIKKRRESQTK